MTVEALDVLANAFLFETANNEAATNESKPRSTHTHTNQVVGPGEAPSRVIMSSRLDEIPPAIFTVESVREVC